MIHADVLGRSRRALIGHIDEAQRALAGKPSDASVHAARKAIKKARCALRLLREALGEPDYRRANAALRDAGRRLAPLRDAKAMADLWGDIRRRHGAQLRQADTAALTMRLQGRLRAERERLAREPGALRSCRHLLAQCRLRLARRHPYGAQGAIAGLRRIYRRGRKALGAAWHAGTPETLHEWRKQVKYLTNALGIVDASGKHARKLGERSDKLADILGEDHDLAELAREAADIGGAARMRRSLSNRIRRRRAKLQKRAFALGAKIYAKKPARETGRLEDSIAAAPA